MSQKAFLEDIAALLEVNASELTDTFELNEDNFDSVAVVSTIALIDEHFDITVRGRDLTNVKSVGELLALIGKTKEES
ncbi:acyl carrier protein [Aminivibrio sp.]|jgi:acyl carrier protein|uniref:acyl carrier protein n=1 Tax=Aminivibrio sp. TaxID=1872489 RepID=UPI003D96F1C4